MRKQRNVGQANFEWVVEAVSEMAIRKAREHQPGRDNLSWGKYVQAAVARRAVNDRPSRRIEQAKDMPKAAVRRSGSLPVGRQRRPATATWDDSALFLRETCARP